MQHRPDKKNAQQLSGKLVAKISPDIIQTFYEKNEEKIFIRETTEGKNCVIYTPQVIN